MEANIWANWIAVVALLVNGTMTFFVIRISIQATKANQKSAKAAEESAEFARKTYESSKQALDIQTSREARLNLFHRKDLSKRIYRYADECWNALLNAYNTSQVDWSKLKNVEARPDFKKDDLALYFEYEEIDSLFGIVESFVRFKEIHVKTLGQVEHNGVSAYQEATSLLIHFSELIKIYANQ